MSLKNITGVDHAVVVVNDLDGAAQNWKRLGFTLSPRGTELEYVFDARDGEADIPGLLRALADLGVAFKDLSTRQSSLEDIFVTLVREGGGAAP